MKITVFSRLSLNALLFLLIPSFNAHCSLENIKGTYDILSDNYKHLSLVHGAIAWETGLIRRLYDLGQIFPTYKDENGKKTIKAYTNLENTHKTIQLIHALFYRVPGSTGESDFGETKLFKMDNASDIAKTTAQIIALIQTIRQDYAGVKDVLNGARKNIDAQLIELNKKLRENFDEMDQEKKNAFFKNASPEVKNSVKQRGLVKKQLDLINKFEQEPALKPNYDNISKISTIQDFVKASKN